MPILIYAVDPTPADPFEGFIGDNFNGTNGDPPNETYWNAIGANPPELYNNKLRCSVTPSLHSSLCRSKFKISGDFDVRATLDDVSGYSSVLGGESAIRVLNVNDTSDSVRVFCDSVGGGGIWTVILQNGSPIVSSGGGVGNDRKVRLRITRVGALVSTWYDASQGDSYTALYSNINWGVSDDVSFDMYISTYTNYPSLTLDFSNFVIAAGTVSAL